MVGVGVWGACSLAATQSTESEGLEMRDLTPEQIEEVSGGADSISGYEGAGAIMAVVGFGSLFTPIGPITAGIAIGAAGGLGGAQFMADGGGSW